MSLLLFHPGTPLLNVRKRYELPRSEHSSRPGTHQQRWLARCLAICLGRPPLVALPRGRCHRLVLDLKGVPRRMAESSIGLQLGHLTGLSVPAYAWRLQGAQAEVWYWSEETPAPASPENTPPLQPGTLPCPEMLLRPALADGLHLIRCRDGYEALSLAQGRIQRTRWFAALPDAAIWQRFVRDAGSDPDHHPLPAAQTLRLTDVPGRTWSIHTSLLRPLKRPTWLMLLAVTLVGAGFFALLSYSVKLSQRIDVVRQEHAALSRESALALSLQQQIESQRKQLAVVADMQPRVLQLRVMSRLAAAGLFDEATKVSLQEWEYRNNRIRLQFAVPAEGFVLGEFLESIEKLGLLTDVRLLPGTPALTVALQAALAGDATPGKSASPAP